MTSFPTIGRRLRGGRPREAALPRRWARAQGLRGRPRDVPRGPDRQRRARGTCAGHGPLFREGRRGLLQADRHGGQGARPRPARLCRLPRTEPTGAH